MDSYSSGITVARALKPVQRIIGLCSHNHLRCCDHLTSKLSSQLYSRLGGRRMNLINPTRASGVSILLLFADSVALDD